MRSVLLFVVSIPGIYFNSVLIVWFITMFAKHGLIFSPSRAFDVMKPLLKTFLYGVIPGAIITNLIALSFEISGPLVILPMAVGILISAFMLHRELMTNSTNASRTNIYILIASLIMILLIGWSVFAMERIHLI